MNKIIVFSQPYSTSNGDYAWCVGVKYGIAYDDYNSNNYYIRRVIDGKEIQPYPVSKEFEGSLYKIEDRDKDQKGS